MRRLQEILKPQNQCKFTGLEKEVECSYPNLIHLEDNFSNVRVLLKKDAAIVAGIALEHCEGLYEVSGLYVEEEHRGQGIARQLFGVCNLIYKGKVRHSDNLTADGLRFVQGEIK